MCIKMYYVNARHVTMYVITNMKIGIINFEKLLSTLFENQVYI